MVVLEQLALEMNMKTEDVIERIQVSCCSSKKLLLLMEYLSKLLQQQGHLTGVFDDRGKYIYISLEEVGAVHYLCLLLYS
jgi:hypothetical protein